MHWKSRAHENTAAHGLESPSPRQENSVLLAFFLSLSLMFVPKVSILTHGQQCFVSTNSQVRHHVVCFVSSFFFKNLSKVSVLSHGQQCFVSIPSFRAKLVFALSVFRFSGSKASMLTKHCCPWVRTDTFEAKQERKNKERKRN